MTPRQRKEAAILKQQAIVNAARADGNRSLTAEEQAEFDGYQREIEQADADINAQERGLAGNTGASAAPPAAVPASTALQMETPLAAAETQRSAMDEERNRVTEIMSLCRDFDVDPMEHIRNGSSLEQVRSEIGRAHV